MTFIALDIGTTFIKGAILDLNQLKIAHIRRAPFPSEVPGLPPLHHEYDPQAILNSVHNVLAELLSLDENPEGLLMCSQMHGVILTTELGQPLSNYISWQDQRVRLPHSSGKGSYLDVLMARVNTEERQALGNELYLGEAISMLFYLAEQGLLPGGIVVPTAIPDFVAANLCTAPVVTEITHAASHGAFNLKTLGWDTEIIARAGLARLQWPEVMLQGSKVGQLSFNGCSIPCYTSSGDYQCALLGVFLQEHEHSLNISTGSQVSRIRPAAEFGDFQTRPFFDGRFTSCITHIPAGRSLNLLVRLLTELATAQQVELADPWPYIIRAATEMDNPRLKVNLAFFNSSCGNHGEILEVRDEEMTVGHLFNASFQNMADNYYASALRFSPEKDWGMLVFSGGLAQKIPVLREIICARFQAKYRSCATFDDTFLGMLALALAYSGRLPSVNKAISLLQEKYAGEYR